MPRIIDPLRDAMRAAARSPMYGPFQVNGEESAYTEQGVVFDGVSDWLEFNNNSWKYPSEVTKALFFLSAKSNLWDGATERYIGNYAWQNACYRGTETNLYARWRNAANTGDACVTAARPITNADNNRFSVLVSIDTDANHQMIIWDGGSWGTEQVVACFGEGLFSAGAGRDLELFAYANGGSQHFNGTVYRIALFAGVAPDVTQAAVRNNFIDAVTGSLVDPAISQAAYGTALIDFYGPASMWNAGQHNGSEGDMLMRGSVVDE